LQGLDDENVQDFLRNNINTVVGRVDLAKVGSNVLETLVANDKDHQLFNEMLNLLQVVIEENKPLLKKVIADESPWLLKGVMQNQVFDRIMVKVNRTFMEVTKDPNHPIRQRFHTEVSQFIHKLKTDPEYQAKAHQLKKELIENETVQHYISNVWLDIKKSVLEDTQSDRSKIRQQIFRAVYGLSNSLLQDKSVREKVNGYLYQAATNVIAQNRHAISTTIADTIRNWDRNTMVEKLETQVGKDLQFIRINGTLVGGLIGLILHVLSEVLRIV
jgi:uncharacterized membrane-anchored protein YjiN (DUF445 family)